MAATPGADIRTRRMAFFDVDETLISLKSMFRFLEFHLRMRGESPDMYEEAADDLRRRAAQGAPREETNRSYYQLYAGRSTAEVAEHGRAWFRTELERDGLFHQPVLKALKSHRAAGDTVALVSGSFAPCLAPIAEYVGADLLLCSEPETAEGRYTGRLETPMIGAAKQEAAIRAMADAGCDPDDCFAYGDHPSDLPLLTAVASRVIVGDDPGLADYATEPGWRRMDPLPPRPPRRDPDTLLSRYLGRAADMVADGYATVSDIDTAMRLGCGLRSGPLELLTDSTSGTAPGRTGRAETPAPGTGGPVPGIHQVGVVGSGTMATGIAAAFLAAGFPVRLLARGPAKAEAAALAVHRALRSARLPAAETEESMTRWSATASVSELAGCALVIEAVAEDLSVKREVLSRVESACGPGTVLVTTTSALPLDRLASGLARPANLVGMHFFNPAPVMELVEVVRGPHTGSEAVAAASDLCERLGKTAVHCTDRAGFIVNALLFPFINDALLLIGEGQASVEEVDLIAKRDCGFPHGPLRLLDIVGADVALAVQRGLSEGLDALDLLPAPLLHHLVDKGVLGLKSGRSIRKYVQNLPTPLGFEVAEDAS